MYNTIFRCFIVRSPEFYIGLFRSLIVPKFLYCSEVWRPHSKKYIEALEKVHTRFQRRVSKRCRSDRDSSTLPTIARLQDTPDRNMFHRLCTLNTDRNLFEFRPNHLRSSLTVRALAVARTDRMNNMFSWRVSRLLRRVSWAAPSAHPNAHHCKGTIIMWYYVNYHVPCNSHTL